MINQIRLIGCQSWEDTTIQLAQDRINIIQAPNNTGKSVLFKILKISVAPKIYTARKRKKLIRKGSTEARAYFAFTDGCIAATVIQQTRVIYLFKENGSQDWGSFVEPPKRMIDELGLLVNEKGTFIANIIDTDQNLLLVDSDAASTTEFIDMLCNNAVLDDYMGKIETASSWALENIASVEWELDKVSRELRNLDYVDIESMQCEIDRVVACKDNLYKVLDLLNCMNKLSGVLQYAKDYDKLLRLEEMLESIGNMHLSECATHVFDVHTIDLCRVLDSVENIKLGTLKPLSEPPSVNLVRVLETVESICLADLQSVIEVPNVELVDALGKLEDLSLNIKKYDSALRIQRDTTDSITALEKEFRNSGTVHKCEIYREVIFNGKECIPCDS